MKTTNKARRLVSTLLGEDDDSEFNPGHAEPDGDELEMPGSKPPAGNDREALLQRVKKAVQRLEADGEGDSLETVLVHCPEELLELLADELEDAADHTGTMSDELDSGEEDDLEEPGETEETPV